MVVLVLVVVLALALAPGCHAPPSRGAPRRETAAADAGPPPPIGPSSSDSAGSPAEPPLVLPSPPGAKWEEVLRPLPYDEDRGSWETRRDYPSGYTSPLREKYTGGPVYTVGRIRRALVGYVQRSASMAFYAYVVEKKEPTTILEHCCPDGGSDLFLAVAGRQGEPVILLVAWGLEEDRARRRALLTRWGASVAAYLDAR